MSIFAKSSSVRTIVVSFVCLYVRLFVCLSVCPSCSVHTFRFIGFKFLQYTWDDNGSPNPALFQESVQNCFHGNDLKYRFSLSFNMGKHTFLRCAFYFAVFFIKFVADVCTATYKITKIKFKVKVEY